MMNMMNMSDDQTDQIKETIDELDAEKGGEIPDKRKLLWNRKKVTGGLSVAPRLLLLAPVPAMVLYFIMANTQEQLREEPQLKVEELSTAWNNTKLMEEEIRHLKLLLSASQDNITMMSADRERLRLLLHNEQQTSVQLAEENKQLRSIFFSDSLSFLLPFCDNSTLQCSRCIPGWTEHNGRCFHLSQNEENWDVARRECFGFGGDLAVVRDAEDQAFLTNMTFQFVQQHPQSYFHSAWIGLQDKVQEGNFSWVDGSPLKYPVKNWKVGEPNNVVASWDKHKTGQDCVAIVPPRRVGGKDWKNNWIDIVCVAERHYICETKALILT